MADFFEQYLAVVKLAFDSGWEAQPLSVYRMNANSISPSELKRFLAACHRGYEKAQNRVVEMLRALDEDKSIGNNERDYRIMLLRKIMDGIATTIFQDRTHLMRRLIVHDEPPRIHLPTIDQALVTANQLNGESRQTFALLADLTTFIHVADVLRIDFRHTPPSVSLIEIKTGRINKLLLEQLKNYEPTEESLKRLASDPALKSLTSDPETLEQYTSQAERILRQKIRRAQIQQIVATDHGKDFQLNVPVTWSKEESAVPTYDKMLNELCDNARKNGLAAGTMNHCLHFGVGDSENGEEAQKKSLACVRFAILKHRETAPTGLAAITEEVGKFVPAQELFNTTNIFRSNLAALAVRPFTVWGIRREHCVSLAKGNLVVLMAFDVTAFLWLCRSIGMEMEFSSRKKAAEDAQKLRRRNVVTWVHRELCYKSPHGLATIGGGILSRFANDLTSPLAFMKSIFNAEMNES